MGEIDDHDWMDLDDHDVDSGFVNCKHCGKMCFWEPGPKGYVLIDYKTEQPHRCHRGLTPAKVKSMFEDVP